MGNLPMRLTQLRPTSARDKREYRGCTSAASNDLADRGENSSRFTGVTWHKSAKKWVARAKVKVTVMATGTAPAKVNVGAERTR